MTDPEFPYSQCCLAEVATPLPSLSFDIDPYSVLGVNRSASLQEIREAYRHKAKRYHPDSGGEDWAFRVVVQAFELLSTARVVQATRPHPQASVHPSTSARAEPRSETVHAGIYDRDIPATHLVAVEHLCVRYLWDDIDFLGLAQKASDQERFLSCSLSLAWPDPQLGDAIHSIQDVDPFLHALVDVFDHVVVATRTTSSQSSVHEGQFSGWLGYGNFDLSWKALKTLHESLRARQLGIRHWSRDLFIPRNWR